MTPGQLATVFGIIVVVALIAFYGLCCFCFGLYCMGRDIWRIWLSRKESLL